MGRTGDLIASILVAVIGVAIIAVLVGQKSQTAGVLQAFGESFSKILAVAVSPVNGTQQ